MEAAARIGEQAGDSQEQRQDRTTGSRALRGWESENRRGICLVARPPRSHAERGNEGMKSRTIIKIMRLLVALICLPLPTGACAQSTAKPAEEADYYKLVRFDLPKGEVIEPGGLEFLPDGKLAIGTRRGEIWLFANPL